VPTSHSVGAIFKALIAFKEIVLNKGTEKRHKNLLKKFECILRLHPRVQNLVCTKRQAFQKAGC